MISLPFKLLLFVMVDGWYLIVKSLIISFSWGGKISWLKIWF
jgi:flagellar biosynthetic protein FliP